MTQDVPDLIYADDQKNVWLPPGILPPDNTAVITHEQSSCLEKAPLAFIHPDQTCFIKGRHLSARLDMSRAAHKWSAYAHSLSK